MELRVIKNENFGYQLLPEHMREGMRRYIEQGVSPGDFLTAVLESDLIGACQRADDINFRRLQDFALFLWNHAPPASYGSKEHVTAWIARGGLEGK